MIIEGRCLDEILRELYDELSVTTDVFHASKGEGRDLLAPKVLLKNPRARISATATRGRLISALAEFCWYMSGSADLEFIRYYIKTYPPTDAEGSIEEAYGPRLLGTGQFGREINQFNRVIERLQAKPDTRRAAIVLLEPTDLDHRKGEAPCTVALQFIRRRERLHLIAMMRSNDAFMGFVHDVFCFTLMQELVARSLGIRIGEYHHFATSLHLYTRDFDNVADYLGEGFQNPTFAMPKMPSGCQLENLGAFLETERAIRQGSITKAAEISLPNYWRDLSLVLLAFADLKNKRRDAFRNNFSEVSDPFYNNFFVKKPKPASKHEAEPIQNEFDLGSKNGGQD